MSKKNFPKENFPPGAVFPIFGALWKHQYLDPFLGFFFLLTIWDPPNRVPEGSHGVFKKISPKKSSASGEFLVSGTSGGKSNVRTLFWPGFFCSPSRILPIGSLRGPKVSKKNFPKKNFPPAGDF